MFASKQKKVENKIAEYCESVTECLDTFQNAVKQYCNEPDRQAVRAAFDAVHKAESHADDIREEIEVSMYSKSLFPESRGDIMGLLEAMDKVPNQAESTIGMLWNQHVEIPETCVPGVLQLVDVCCRTGDAMVESVMKLFSDFTTAAVVVGKIDRLESEADDIEDVLIEQLFAKPADNIATIVLRDFIKHVAQISDRAENAGDRIRIIVAKRSV